MRLKLRPTVGLAGIASLVLAVGRTVAATVRRRHGHREVPLGDHRGPAHRTARPGRGDQDDRRREWSRRAGAARRAANPAAAWLRRLNRERRRALRRAQLHPARPGHAERRPLRRALRLQQHRPGRRRGRRRHRRARGLGPARARRLPGDRRRRRSASSTPASTRPTTRTCPARPWTARSRVASAASRRLQIQEGTLRRRQRPRHPRGRHDRGQGQQRRRRGGRVVQLAARASAGRCGGPLGSGSTATWPTASPGLHDRRAPR